MYKKLYPYEENDNHLKDVLLIVYAHGFSQYLWNYYIVRNNIESFHLNLILYLIFDLFIGLFGLDDFITRFNSIGANQFGLRGHLTIDSCDSGEISEATRNFG